MAIEKIVDESLNIAEIETRTTSSDEEPTWSEEEETRVRHKLDWQVVPMVTILYLMCFLDR